MHGGASLNCADLLVANNRVGGHQRVSAALALRLDLSDIRVVILREREVSLTLHVTDNRARSINVIDLVD